MQISDNNNNDIIEVLPFGLIKVSVNLEQHLHFHFALQDHAVQYCVAYCQRQYVLLNRFIVSPSNCDINSIKLHKQKAKISF